MIQWQYDDTASKYLWETFNMSITQTLNMKNTDRNQFFTIFFPLSLNAANWQKCNSIALFYIFL